MRSRAAMAVLLTLILSGCPGTGGFFGRYLVVNNTDSTVSKLTISDDLGSEQSWDEVRAGNGLIRSEPLPGGPSYLTVSWSDRTGNHKERVSLNRRTDRRSQAVLFIELNPQGKLYWRIIESPTKDGNPAAPSLIAGAYVGYCLAVGLMLGVPLAIAAVIAYGTFKLLRHALVETVESLRNDRAVFQFSIREIFMLTTAAALALGWYMYFMATKGH